MSQAGLANTTHLWLTTAPPNGTVYWKIAASNGEKEDFSDPSSFFFNQCTDSPP